jgi:hypothetical protein
MKDVNQVPKSVFPVLGPANQAAGDNALIVVNTSSGDVLITLDLPESVPLGYEQRILHEVTGGVLAVDAVSPPGFKGAPLFESADAGELLCRRGYGGWTFAWAGATPPELPSEVPKYLELDLTGGGSQVLDASSVPEILVCLTDESSGTITLPSLPDDRELLVKLQAPAVPSADVDLFIQDSVGAIKQLRVSYPAAGASKISEDSVRLIADSAAAGRWRVVVTNSWVVPPAP